MSYGGGDEKGLIGGRKKDELRSKANAMKKNGKRFAPFPENN